jgi:thiol-disulfide isomerase/thioredoxin
MSVRTRWALVALVLVVAAAIAFWPRGSDRSDQSPQAAPPPQPTADLSAARAAAKLPACPSPHAGTAPAALTGVRTTCLGTGKAVDLGKALAGRTTVINVWATWCQPCRTELPVLADYAKQFGAAQVLAVQWNSSAADGLDLLKSLGVKLPVVYDTGAVGKALRLPPGLPASYVVNPHGQLKMITSPRVFETPKQVASAVREYSR